MLLTSFTLFLHASHLTGGLGGSTSFGQNKVSGSWNRGPSGSDNYGVDYSRSFDNNRGSVGASFSRSGGSNSFGLNLKCEWESGKRDVRFWPKLVQVGTKV